MHRIVALRGPVRRGRLVNGENGFVPARTRSMGLHGRRRCPKGLGADLVAVGFEIHTVLPILKRGHVFTDRLLRARRSARDRYFMGSEPCAGHCCPWCQRRNSFGATEECLEFVLFWVSKKISRDCVHVRSDCRLFSVKCIYAIAELIRVKRGGAAALMGALSPRYAQWLRSPMYKTAKSTTGSHRSPSGKWG